MNSSLVTVLPRFLGKETYISPSNKRDVSSPYEKIKWNEKCCWNQFWKIECHKNEMRTEFTKLVSCARCHFLIFKIFMMWTIFKVVTGFVTILLLFYVSYFFVYEACGTLASEPGIKLAPPSLEGCLNHWTSREVRRCLVKYQRYQRKQKRQKSLVLLMSFIF